MGREFLKIDHMRKVFGELEVIKDISLSVQEGEVETMQLDVSASTGTISLLGILFTAGIPVALLIVGLAIYLKRRHL